MLSYLLATEERPHRSELTYDEYKGLEANGSDILKVTRTWRGTYVTFRVKVKRERGTNAGALVLGSIVEGSDACCVPVELWFPFTGEDLDNAISEIEAEAEWLWLEANEPDA